MHAVVVLALAGFAAAGPSRTKVAILEVEAPEAQQETARLLNQVVEGEFAKHPELAVTSASEVSATLGLARQRSLLGCAEDSCLAEIGGALGVEFIVHGKLGKLGRRYRFDLRLVNARNGRIAGTAGDFIAGEDALADAAVRLSDALVAQVPGIATRPAETRELTAPPPASLAVSSEAPPSRTRAYVAFGAAGVLAAGAVAMTLVTRSTFNDVVNRQPGASADSLSWKGPVADGLWVGALAAAGVGTYWYLSAAPSAGGGGEVAVGGRF